MVSLQKRVLQSLTLAMASIIFLLPENSQTNAAPLYSPLRYVVLTLSQLPFPHAGWTVQRFPGILAVNRFNSFMDAVHKDWQFSPQSCVITNYQTLSLARRVLSSAEIETFTQKSTDKNAIIALVPDSRDIENFIPTAMDKLDHCTQISGHTINPNPADQAKVQASVRAAAKPTAEAATQIYSYDLIGDADIPQAGRQYTNKISGDAHDQRAHRHGAGRVYLAQLRNIWLMVLEGGTDGNIAELQPLFDKQVQKINAAL